MIKERMKKTLEALKKIGYNIVDIDAKRNRVTFEPPLSDLTFIIEEDSFGDPEGDETDENCYSIYLAPNKDSHFHLNTRDSVFISNWPDVDINETMRQIRWFVNSYLKAKKNTNYLHTAGFKQFVNHVLYKIKYMVPDEPENHNMGGPVIAIKSIDEEKFKAVFNYRNEYGRASVDGKSYILVGNIELTMKQLKPRNDLWNLSVKIKINKAIDQETQKIIPVSFETENDENYEVLRKSGDKRWPDPNDVGFFIDDEIHHAWIEFKFGKEASDQDREFKSGFKNWLDDNQK